MVDKFYNRIANSLVAIAILSAFLFDASGEFKQFVGGIGILAALGATVLYLCYGAHVRSEIKETCRISTRDDDSHKGSKTLDRPGFSDASVEDKEDSIRMHWSAEPIDLGSPQLYEVKRTFWTSKSVHYVALERQHTEKEAFVNYAVEVIKQLSAGEHRGKWEFLLSPGEVLVREARRHESYFDEEHQVNVSDHISSSLVQ